MDGVAVVVLLAVCTPPSSSVVWIPGAADAELVERLRGHLSDIPWTIKRGGPEAISARPPPNSDATVRFESLGSGGLRMRLELPDGRRWRREVHSMEPAAAYEAAGLILRSALLAIDEGSTPGWVPDPPATPITAGWGWRAAVRTEANGLAPPVGLEIMAFRRWQHWSAGSSAAARWPLVIEESGTKVRIGRYDLALTGGWSARSGSWAYGGRVGGGTTLWHRTTAEGGPNATSRPGTLQIGGLLTGAGWLSRRLNENWAITLEIGVDGLPGAPEWTLDDGTPIAAPWLIQPWIALGIGTDPHFRLGR